MGDVFFNGFRQIFVLKACKFRRGFAVQTAFKKQTCVIKPSACEIGMTLQQGFVFLFGGFPPAFASSQRGAGKRSDIRIVFALPGITLQQRANGLPITAVDGIKQCLALVGFGIFLGCLPGIMEQKYQDDIRALFVPAPAWFGGYPATGVVRGGRLKNQNAARQGWGRREAESGRQTVCTWDQLSSRKFQTTLRNLEASV